MAPKLQMSTFLVMLPVWFNKISGDAYIKVPRLVSESSTCFA